MNEGGGKPWTDGEDREQRAEDLDSRLIALLGERVRLAREEEDRISWWDGITRLRKTVERVRREAEAAGLDSRQMLSIYRYAWTVLGIGNRARDRAVELRSLPLQAVIPLLRTVQCDLGEVTVTHMEQYEQGSIVLVRIRNAEHGEPRFDLEIRDDHGTVYRLEPQGGGGGSGEWRRAFRVFPRLPDQAEEIHFRLLPPGNDDPFPRPPLHPLSAPVDLPEPV